jgi:hypothetical protein
VRQQPGTHSSRGDQVQGSIPFPKLQAALLWMNAIRCTLRAHPNLVPIHIPMPMTQAHPVAAPLQAVSNLARRGVHDG